MQEGKQVRRREGEGFQVEQAQRGSGGPEGLSSAGGGTHLDRLTHAGAQGMASSLQVRGQILQAWTGLPEAHLSGLVRLQWALKHWRRLPTLSGWVTLWTSDVRFTE